MSSDITRCLWLHEFFIVATNQRCKNSYSMYIKENMTRQQFPRVNVSYNPLGQMPSI